MKFGEKLQKLRKQRGLSQEQLAAQLTVSRQAVSRWELVDTMPDTENVIQLSRLFGVSCDYLLRDEVNEQGAPLPTLEPPLPTLEPPLSAPVSPRPTPGEAHLTEQGWIHNAFILSLGVCALGLVGAFMFYRFQGHTVRPLAIGFMIQLLGAILFELATPRMGGRRNTARLSFYATACWLVLPIPVLLSLNWGFNLGYWNGTPLQGLICYFSVYQLLSAAVTAALLLLRQRICAKR
jgi:transcriptional regulator with XRE-family HTH domain